jgi:hypothetical protein
MYEREGTENHRRTELNQRKAPVDQQTVELTLATYALCNAL